MIARLDRHWLQRHAGSDWLRWTLGGLLAFGALNAFGGGLYGMSGAESVPLEWLHGSPFSDYCVPGLVLALVVGGAMTYASVSVLLRWRSGPLAAFAAGLVLVGWMAVQVAIIGYVSWMQAVTLLAGFTVIELSWLLADELD